MKQPVIIHIANEADWTAVMKKIEQIWPEARWKHDKLKPSLHNYTNYSDELCVRVNNNEIGYGSLSIYKTDCPSIPIIPASSFLTDGQGELTNGYLPITYQFSNWWIGIPQNGKDHYELTREEILCLFNAFHQQFNTPTKPQKMNEQTETDQLQTRIDELEKGNKALMLIYNEVHEENKRLRDRLSFWLSFLQPFLNTLRDLQQNFAFDKQTLTDEETP